MSEPIQDDAINRIRYAEGGQAGQFDAIYYVAAEHARRIEEHNRRIEDNNKRLDDIGRIQAVQADTIASIAKIDVDGLKRLQTVVFGDQQLGLPAIHSQITELHKSVRLAIWGGTAAIVGMVVIILWIVLFTQ